MAVIKSEFFLALNQVATERGISPDDVLESIKSAVLAAYRKDYGPEEAQATEEDEPIDDGIEVKINQESGEMHITQNGQDITPPGFGRIAAQTARQVILQQIREAEKRNIVQHYTGQIGSIVKGRIIRFEGRNVLLDIGKAEGFLPVEEQIRTERYHLNDSIMVYIKEIKEDAYNNSRIILSRSDIELVKQLFMKEVPEIESGTVVIKAVVREPGDRTKIAVASDQPGVDPVGACVGQKGIRVKSVTDELGGAEKIDIIQYNADDASFIREALSPAKVQSVTLDKKNERAIVTVDEEQAPLAIGQHGVNVNLAGRLTGYTIDISQIEGEKPKEEKVVEPEAAAEETPSEETVEPEAVEEASESEASEEPKAEEVEVVEPEAAAEESKDEEATPEEVSTDDSEAPDPETPTENSDKEAAQSES